MAKTTFKQEYIERVKKLNEIGMGMRDLADIFDVSTTTIYKWRKRNKAFDQAIRNGKREIDTQVSSALLKRLIGYDKEEVTTIIDKDGNTVTKTVIKHYPAEANVALKWLISRWPEYFEEQKIEPELPKTRAEIDEKLKEFDQRRKLLNK